MQKNIDIELTCSKCKRSYPVKELKYDIYKNLLCNKCLEERYNTKEGVHKMAETKNRKQEDPYEKKVKYKCQTCKMSFLLKRRPDIRKRCPYCGRENIIEQDFELSVDELIKEASKKEYDF